MLFRVQCVDKATGAQTDRIYRADAPDRAAEMAMREGYIVGHVYPEADVPLAPSQPGRLASYTRNAGRTANLEAFFRFEYMISPIMIRSGFIIVTLLTFVVSVGAPILWLYLDTDRSAEGAGIAASAIGGAWLLWVGYRIIAESRIVYFSIYEQLGEIRRNTMPRE